MSTLTSPTIMKLHTSPCHPLCLTQWGSFRSQRNPIRFFKLIKTLKCATHEVFGPPAYHPLIVFLRFRTSSPTNQTMSFYELTSPPQCSKSRGRFLLYYVPYSHCVLSVREIVRVFCEKALDCGFPPPLFNIIFKF